MKIRSVVAPACLALGVTLYYVFVVSAGTFTRWPTYTNFSDLQAEGFRAGHLHLSQAPLPALLAQTNPRDPIHGPLWLWDASLYNGQYYMYWGPVPSLLLAAAKAGLRFNKEVGDQVPAFSFLVLWWATTALLIFRIGPAFGQTKNRWPLFLAAAVTAVATPIPFLLARAAIYETGIAAGQFFLVLGVLCGLYAMRAPRSALQSRWLWAAGTAWALGLGSRITLLPTIGLLTLVVAAAVPAPERFWRGRIPRWIKMAIPLVLAMAALGYYNRLRFGSWTDFGTNHQLSWMLFKWDRIFVPYNTFAYLLRPLRLSCTFPFVTAPFEDIKKAFPKSFSLPAGIDGEPLSGILLASPWILGIAVFLAIGLLRLNGFSKRATPSSLMAIPSREQTEGWSVKSYSLLAFAIMAVAPAPIILGMWISTMRYAFDISTGWLLLGTTGMWTALHRVRGTAKSIAIVPAVVATACATIIVGILLGFSGYYDHFKTQNLQLFEALASHLRLCH